MIFKKEPRTPAVPTPSPAIPANSASRLQGEYELASTERLAAEATRDSVVAGYEVTRSEREKASTSSEAKGLRVQADEIDDEVVVAEGRLSLALKAEAAAKGRWLSAVAEEKRLRDAQRRHEALAEGLAAAGETARFLELARAQRMIAEERLRELGTLGASHEMQQLRIAIPLRIR